MGPTFKAFLPSIYAILPVIRIDLDAKMVDCGNDDYGYDWCGYRYAEGANGEEADCILLRGTGQYSKDHTEIFEGDILKDSQGNIFCVRWDSKKSQWYGQGDFFASLVSELSPQYFALTQICGNTHV